MKARKFSKNNKDKKVNTIIEIRKEILQILHDISNDLDRELYNSTERTKINREVREIAEMIRDKDRYMSKMMCLEPVSKSGIRVEDDLIRDTRKKIRALLKLKAYNITVGIYDSEELEIVFKEIEDAKELIYEKDRLIRSRREDVEDGELEIGINPHIKKYFKVDDEQEIG